jgi:hypothetical protein
MRPVKGSLVRLPSLWGAVVVGAVVWYGLWKLVAGIMEKLR